MKADGRIRMFRLPVSGFAYHVQTDKGEKNKCDPVIDRLNVALKSYAQNVAKRRHGSLKSPKIQTDDDGVTPVHLLHGETLTDCNCKCIH